MTGMRKIYIAEQLGVDPETSNAKKIYRIDSMVLQKLEKGQYIPIDDIKKLAGIFKVDLGYLLFGEENHLAQEKSPYITRKDFAEYLEGQGLDDKQTEQIESQIAFLKSQK